MLITNEFLEQFKPCRLGLAQFNRLFPNGLDSRSVEDIRLAIKNKLDVYWVMENFNKVFDTEEVVCEILKYKGQLLKWIAIPITKKMVDIAINSSIRAFTSVPAEFQTEEMVYKALVYDGEYLKDVRIPITQKMVDIAVNNTMRASFYVPAEFKKGV